MQDEAVRVEMERLRERAARERRARDEAEAVAEEGTRQLYERQRQLQLLNVVADAASGAASATAVLQVALDQLCGYTAWPVGHAYLVTEDPAYPLVPSGLWHLDDAHEFAAFRHITERTRFRHGEGLPGRVLERGEAVWVIDVVQDADFARTRQAQAIGACSAFGIPVRVGANVIAVLEFFSREPARPDQSWLALATQVGVQVGRAFERQRANDALRAINAHLQQEIAEREAAQIGLQRARDEADRANRAKSDFLSRMSHELRTPLNAILGFAQLLEMDDLSDEHHESTRHILRGGAHLLELINEVLDLARIESGRLSLALEAVAAGEIIRNTVDLVRPLAAPRGITFDEDDEAPATGRARQLLVDRSRLQQILLNLLSNAVKYNHDGGRVRVACTEAAGGRLRISVSDTGAGIAPGKLGRLFQPFERLDADQTAIEGTGLGLALSKALAEAMGGTLGVESEVDRGSTFWVELPVAGPVPAAAPSSGTASAIAASLDSGVTGTVLYIEDNISNRRLMERLLARRPGVRLLAAPDGQTGLALARAERPDLILLDLHLPDMPGEEVLRRLTDDASTHAIPVSVLSADATPARTARLLAAGACAYLTKPLDIRRVLQLVDGTLGKRS